MYVICVIWNLAKFYKGDAGTQSATLLTTKEEISTVLAEKLGSGVEGEERSQPRHASTFFSELLSV